jgi:hypothetical protein
MGLKKVLFNSKNTETIKCIYAISKKDMEFSVSEIKIVAPNSDLKGKSFERFMQLVLDKLGYGNIKVRVHTTGMELDIEARDNSLRM